MLRHEPPIESFLGALDQRLRPQLDEAYLQSILAETEAHLRQSVEEMIELGIPPLEAERAAIAAYGRPRFERSESRWASRWAVLSGCAAFSLAITSLDDFGRIENVSFPLVGSIIGIPLVLFASLGLRSSPARLRPFKKVALFGFLFLLFGLPSRFFPSVNDWNFQAFLPHVNDRPYIQGSLEWLRNPESITSITTNEGRLRRFRAARADRSLGLGPVPEWPAEEPLARMPLGQANQAWKEHGEEIESSMRDFIRRQLGQEKELQATLRVSYGARLVQLSLWAVVIPALWTLLSLTFQSAGYGVFLATRARRPRRNVA